MKINSQAPSAVVMVRPHFFSPNQQTANDNVFQKQSTQPLSEVNQNAFNEVSSAIETLACAGVKVYAFDDKGTKTPDSVFPNNWFSSHGCGTLVIYPMYCENRRLEVNPAVLSRLEDDFIVNKRVDYSDLAVRHKYLEGTGAMVLDHENKIAYAVRSKRMDEDVLQQFCQELGFTPCIFGASDDNNIPIYHTNVLMCVASDFVMIGLDMIKDKVERGLVSQTISKTGKELIELSTEQINNFAGNTLELNTQTGKVLVMSQTAYDTLKQEQLTAIKQYVEIVVVSIPTIELAGGSIRCMIAGIHLKPKTH